MPETKGLSLEELDQVFGVPTRKHAAWGLRSLSYFFKRYLLRKHVELEQLYQREEPDEDVGFDDASMNEKGKF